MTWIVLDYSISHLYIKHDSEILSCIIHLKNQENSLTDMKKFHMWIIANNFFIIFNAGKWERDNRNKLDKKVRTFVWMFLSLGGNFATKEI